MTLSVDEVRNIRFPMARKPSEDGYRASAVDNFIDRLEVSYAQLVEENERLREQATASPEAGHDSAELGSLRSENERLRAGQAEAEQRVTQLQQDNEALHQQITELQSRNGELEQRLNQQQNESAQAFSGQQDANDAELSRLRSQTEQLRAEADQQRTAREQLATEKDTLAAEKDALAGEKDHLAEENARLVAELTELRNRPAVPAAESTGTFPAYVVPTDADGHLVVTTSAEASPAVIRLVELATMQADEVLNEAQQSAATAREDAQAEASRVVEEANARAEELLNSTEQEAERARNEARQNAERLVTEAQTRADALDGEVLARRNELFTELERERDTFVGKVATLREFESNYRATMVSHLQAQLEQLRTGNFQPRNRPELMDGGSATPRLDALLAADEGQR